MTKCNLLTDYEERLQRFDRNPREWARDGISREDLETRRQAIAEIVETLTESECQIISDLRDCQINGLTARIARITRAFADAEREIRRVNYERAMLGGKRPEDIDLRNVLSIVSLRDTGGDRPLPPAA